MNRFEFIIFVVYYLVALGFVLNHVISIDFPNPLIRAFFVGIILIICAVSFPMKMFAKIPKRSSDRTHEQMTLEVKYENLQRLAHNMYKEAQYLKTDASRLRKAMEEYHQFIINNNKE